MSRDLAGPVQRAEGGDDSALQSLAYEFFDACKSRRLDLIAITDHHSIEGYSRFINYLDEWIQHSGHSLYILPGVEITFGDGVPVHALVLFDESVETERVSRYINALFDGQSPFDESGNPVSSMQGPEAFARRTREILVPTRIPYLVIPAHIDSNRGLRREHHFRNWIGDFEGSPRQRAFAQELWSAFQVRRDPSEHRDLESLLRSWLCIRRFGRPRSELRTDEWAEVERCAHWPVIVASDPHTLEEIGSRFTWMKMDSPSIEGVRLALHDPESRLRIDADLDVQHKTWIRQVHICSTDFFDDLTVQFNRDLNVLIGGRGTGKSMLIELMRYALGLDREDAFASRDGEVRQRVEKLLAPKNARDSGNTSGALLPDHEVSVELEIEGKLYRVVRSQGGHAIWDGDGEIVDIDLRALVSPRFLSQREIAEVASVPEAQRAELDRIDGGRRAEAFERDREELLAELEGQLAKRRRLENDLEHVRTLRARLARSSSRLELVEGASEDPILSQRASVEDQKRYLGRVDETLDSLVDDAQQLRERLESAFPSPPPPGPAEASLLDFAELLRRSQAAAVASLDEALATLIHLRDVERSRLAAQLLTVFESIQSSYDDLVAELRDQGVDIAEHETLSSEVAQLKREIQELEAVEEQLRDAVTAVGNVRQRLVALHMERFAHRESQAATLVERDADVRLEVTAFGDRAEVRSFLTDLFAGTGMRSDDINALSDWVVQEGGSSVPERLWQLAKALESDIDAMAGELQTPRLESTHLGQAVGAQRLSGHVVGALQRSGEVNITELEQFLPNDSVSAMARRAGQDDFVQIGQGSVGQQATAILSLLLAGGQDPLIVDQPEDDLDNQYVFSVVVELLRKIKSNRQVIVASHNANIPVNGDAEAIIEMSVVGGLGSLAAVGSIDRSEVKEAVSLIMEGSSEAFRLRRERYGF